MVAQQGNRRFADRHASLGVVAACGAVAIALALGACSPGSPTPTPPSSPTEPATVSPTPSPTPSPTEEPSPTPDPTPTQSEDRSELLIQPEAMENDDEAGAIAAAKYYIGLFEYVHATGDLEMWEAMALPGCEFCDVVAEGVRAIYGPGGRQDMGRVTFVGDPTTNFINGVNVWEVNLRIKIGASTIYDANDEVTKEYGVAKNKVNVGVVQMGGAWRIQGMQASDDD